MYYYQIPFRPDEIMRGKRQHDEVELRQAIHQNIRLILKTFSMSYRFDPTFGSIMNKFHASTPPQKTPERVWRERMRENIQKNLIDMMQRYETRIQIKDLIIDMQQPPGQSNRATVHVKVQISGQLTLGRKEKFHFPDSEIAEGAMEVFPLMIPIGKGTN